MNDSTLTNSTIEDWEHRTLLKLNEIRRSVEQQAAVSKQHLIGVDRLLSDANQIADHEKIARLTGELALMRARAETAEADLKKIRDVLNPMWPGHPDWDGE